MEYRHQHHNLLTVFYLKCKLAFMIQVHKVFFFFFLFWVRSPQRKAANILDLIIMEGYDLPNELVHGWFGFEACSCLDCGFVECTYCGYFLRFDWVQIGRNEHVPCNLEKGLLYRSLGGNFNYKNWTANYFERQNILLYS